MTRFKTTRNRSKARLTTEPFSMEASLPTDSAGNYSLPPGYLAVAGTTIRAEQHNAPLQDVAQGLSDRLMRDGRNGMVGDLDMGSYRIRNVAPGRTTNDALTVAQGFPIGGVVDFGGETAPAGWMLCFGQAVSRATYPELFAAIGTRFGAGNGSTTFNLPDFRGRTSAGRDDMGGTDATRLTFYGAVAKAIGGALGAATHVLTLAQAPSHNHTGSTGAAGIHNHSGATLGGGSHSHTGQTNTTGSHVHGISTNDNQATGRSGVRAGNTAAFGVTQLSEPAGDHAHSLQIAAVGDHNHGIPTDGNHAHSVQTDTRGGDEPHPIAQPTLIMNKIIKVSL